MDVDTTNPVIVVTKVEPALLVSVTITPAVAMPAVVPAGTEEPGIVVTIVLPAESVIVEIRAAPGMPVFAAPRSALKADSRD